MTFASRDVVEKLMDIGGDALVEKDGLALLGERPCLFRGAIVSGRCDNIKLLLERYPQYASALNPEFGTSALHMATGTTACRGQKKVMETLLSFPALREALTTVNSPVYGSVLASAMKFNDQDPETVRLGA